MRREDCPGGRGTSPRCDARPEGGLHFVTVVTVNAWIKAMKANPGGREEEKGYEASCLARASDNGDNTAPLGVASQAAQRRFEAIVTVLGCCSDNLPRRLGSAHSALGAAPGSVAERRSIPAHTLFDLIGCQPRCQKPKSFRKRRSSRDHGGYFVIKRYVPIALAESPADALRNCKVRRN
jgi:hypothetical protein